MTKAIHNKFWPYCLSEIAWDFDSIASCVLCYLNQPVNDFDLLSLCTLWIALKAIRDFSNRKSNTSYISGTHFSTAIGMRYKKSKFLFRNLVTGNHLKRQRTPKDEERHPTESSQKKKTATPNWKQPKEIETASSRASLFILGGSLYVTPLTTIKSNLIYFRSNLS